MTRLRAAFAAAALAVAASGMAASSAPQGPPLPRGTIGPTVTMVRLAGGGTGIVRPLSGSPVAAVQLWFRAPSIGFDASPRPGIAYVAAYAIAASRPLTGTPLSTLVTRVGGRLSISVYPRAVAISTLVPASQAAVVMRAMSADFFTPVLSQDGLSQAVTAVRQETRVREIAAPEEILRNGLFAALFADGPNHYAPTGDDGDPRRFTLDDVRNFASRAFRAANATAVLTGDVDAKVADAAVEGRPGPRTTEAPLSSLAQLEKAPRTVDRKGVVPGFGYAWAGPPISSEREATALDFVADYLFNPDSGTISRRFSNAEVAINAQYVTYFNPGVFYVEATGVAADRARAAIDEALAALRTPLDPNVFAAARTMFEYHVASDVSTPVALADNFGWYASEADVRYAPGADLDNGRYMGAIKSLTPEFVSATAQKYLAAAHAVVTLTVPPPETPPPMPTGRRRSTP